MDTWRTVVLNKIKPESISKENLFVPAPVCKWVSKPQYSATAPWEDVRLTQAKLAIAIGLPDPICSHVPTVTHSELVNKFWDKYLTSCHQTYTVTPSWDELLALSKKVAARDDKKLKEISVQANNHQKIFENTGLPVGCDLRILKDLLPIAVTAVMHLKLEIDRPRPYQLFPEFVCGEFDVRDVLAKFFPLHSSFPSGHSTELHFLAYIVGDLCPSSANTATKYAYHVAENREYAGLHFPSDTQAGIVLAKLLFDELKKSAGYKAFKQSCNCE
jgi:PAP2 superfamily